MYIICKTSRIGTDRTYSGITWDKANIRNRYRETYSNYTEANDIAFELTKYNPVGFVVMRKPI